MRIILIIIQLAIFGWLYTVVAVPVVAAFYGLLFAMATAMGMLLTMIGITGLEIIGGALAQFLPALGGTAAHGSVVVAAATSLAEVATVLFYVALPLLLTCLANLILGFFSYGLRSLSDFSGLGQLFFL